MILYWDNSIHFYKTRKRIMVTDRREGDGYFTIYPIKYSYFISALFSAIMFINSLRPSDAYMCRYDKLTIIGSDNGLSPGRRQAIIWTNVGILLIGPLGRKVSEILSGIQIFSFKKMHLKMSSAKWRPFCLGLNVSKIFSLYWTVFYSLFYRTTRLNFINDIVLFRDAVVSGFS